MEDFKFLVVEKYDGNEIRVVFSKKQNCINLDNTYVIDCNNNILFSDKNLCEDFFCDNLYVRKVVFYLDDLNLCNYISDKFNDIEKKIDVINNKIHENTMNRVLYFYTIYLDNMIEFYIDLDYETNTVWCSNGVSMRKISFVDVIPFIRDELISIKERVYKKSLSKKNDYLVTKLENLKCNLCHKHYVKKYPELF